MRVKNYVVFVLRVFYSEKTLLSGMAIINNCNRQNISYFLDVVVVSRTGNIIGVRAATDSKPKENATI